MQYYVYRVRSAWSYTDQDSFQMRERLWPGDGAYVLVLTSWY